MSAFRCSALTLFIYWHCVLWKICLILYIIRQIINTLYTMRRLFLLVALLGVLGMGCSENEELNVSQDPTENPGDDTTPEETPIFTIDNDGDIVVIAEGGEVTIAVTTNIEYCIVIPEEAQSWLSIADTRATLREEVLTFIIAENTTFEERTAYVDLVDSDGEVLETIAFVQSGQSKIFEARPGDNSIIPLTNDSCEIEVFVTANLEYSVVIAGEAQSWLSVADTRASLRDEIVTIVVAENKSYVGRSADVMFVDSDGEVLATITIVQDGAMLPEGE